ncbi:hypothetical protein GEMRC1_008661 [Eukaryota sp. GEM-RC1]
MSEARRSLCEDLSVTEFPNSQSIKKDFFLEHFLAVRTASEVKSHPLADYQFLFSYGAGWNFERVDRTTIKKWVNAWLSSTPEARKVSAFSVKVAADNVTSKEYDQYLKTTDKSEARSVTVEHLQQENPSIDASDTAWASWASLYAEDPTVTTTAIPSKICQLFTNPSATVDNDDESQKENDAIYQLIAKEVIDAKEASVKLLETRTENLVAVIPSLIRTARKRVSSVARLSKEVIAQMKKVNNGPNSHF